MRNFSTGRSARTAADPTVHAPNAALLIDFDNVTMGVRSDLQNQLRRLMNSEMIKGKVAVQRAYADWRRYPQYIVPLSESSIDLIFAPAFGSNKKNATDIRLAIDALELVFTRPEIGTFILLSGDSDFSSLVLKLKEYGKYIIGVGIRESSSDLLIQNCDEYYSYNELTGFTKEHETEHVSKDPWELVVEAVVQMRKDDDVMRSDRLKQVMQGIDPTFSEKDAGFSRFSKFVTDAQKRGLLTLTKLDNGQYEVDVGDNANVSPEEEKALNAKPRTESKEPRGRSRRGRRGGAKSREAGGLSLSEAFELMRQALLVLGAVGEDAAPGESVRAKMIELVGADGDPVFERPKFQRLLRQAHDADLIELVKQDDDYLMKLTAGAVDESPAAAPPEAPAASEAESSADEGEEKAPKKKPAAKSRTRSRRTKSAATKTKSEKATTESEEPAAERADESGDVAAETTTAKRRRSPRYRRGSKGQESAQAAENDTTTKVGKVSEADAAAKAKPKPKPKADAAATPKADDAAKPAAKRSRRVGPRRGGRAKADEGGSGATAAVGKVESSPTTERAASRREPDAPSEPSTPASPSEGARQAPVVSAPPAEAPAEESGSLLKRMGAAFQKAMRGEEGDTPE